MYIERPRMPVYEKGNLHDIVSHQWAIETYKQQQAVKTSERNTVSDSKNYRAANNAR